MMEDAPEDAEDTTPFYKGPPQQVVHPPPTEDQLPGKPVRKVDMIAEMQAAQVLHDNFASHKPTLQDALQKG